MKDVHELTEFEALMWLLGSKTKEQQDYFASYGESSLNSKKRKESYERF